MAINPVQVIASAKMFLLPKREGRPVQKRLFNDDYPAHLWCYTVERRDMNFMIDREPWWGEWKVDKSSVSHFRNREDAEKEVARRAEIDKKYFETLEYRLGWKYLTYEPGPDETWIK